MLLHYFSYTNRIVQSFESIIDTLISQETFTDILVIEEDVALIAQQVSALGNQLCILLAYLKIIDVLILLDTKR